MYLTLQDQPNRWSFETYGRITNSQYFEVPYDGILNKQPEYRFTLEILDQNFKRRASEDLFDAERWVGLQFVNPNHVAKLKVFNKDGDIDFTSLHPFKFQRSTTPTPEHLEGQMVRVVFNLFNYDHGDIIAQVRTMECVSDDYNPDHERGEDEVGEDDGW